MARRFPYDTNFEPPAPVVRVRVAHPNGERAVEAAAIVDTGADGSVITPALASYLDLPVSGRAVSVQAVGAEPQTATEYHGRLDLGERSHRLPIIALGDEIILGRDVLNALTVRLIGPELILELA